MKNLSIQTKSGATILPPNYIIPVVENGQIVEKYAFELKSGDTVIYHKESAPITLDELVEISYASIPSYREARDLYFYRKEGYEVTRLRKDIIGSVAEQRPQTFSEEELQNLEDYTLKKDGEDFSIQAQDNILNYVVSLFEPFGHSRSTYKSWIDGEVIHPEDHIETVEIAKILGNEDFRQRAIYTEITPKSEGNKYWMMTDFHRVMLSILSPLRKHAAKGKISKEKLEEIYHRVYMDFPFWYKPVIEKVRPKLEESIVYSPVTEVKVVESETVPIKMRANTELKKGVVGFESVDEIEKENLFQKLKLEKPIISRNNQLIKNLNERFELIKEFTENTTGIIISQYLFYEKPEHRETLIHDVKKLLEEDIEKVVSKLEINKFIKDVLSSYIVKAHNCINSFIAPLYSSENDVKKFTEMERNFYKHMIMDKEYRKKVKLDLKRNILPEFFREHASKIYNESNLLKYLFSREKADKILFTPEIKELYPNLKTCGSIEPARRIEFISGIDSRFNEKSKIVRYIFNLKFLKDVINKNREFNGKIPIELRYLQHMTDTSVHDRMGVLLDKYGIDIEWFKKKVLEIHEIEANHTVAAIATYEQLDQSMIESP